MGGTFRHFIAEPELIRFGMVPDILGRNTGPGPALSLWPRDNGTEPIPWPVQAGSAVRQS